MDTLSKLKPVMLFDLNDTLIKESGRIAYFTKLGLFDIEVDCSSEGVDKYFEVVRSGILNGEIVVTSLSNVVDILRNNSRRGIENWVYSTNREDLTEFVLERCGIKSFFTGFFSTLTLDGTKKKTKQNFIALFENLFKKGRRLALFCDDDAVSIQAAFDAFNVIKERYQCEFLILQNIKEININKYNKEVNKMELQTAKGVRDIPPEEKILKNKVVDSLVRIFELYGFMPLETPLLERYETLAAKGGAGTESDALKETFTLTDQGNRKLGLRFELTTSLARYVAMNPTVKMPFKRYELGPVFRDGPIKLGRYREFWQCDVDTIGSSSMLSEAEFLGVATDFFKFWNVSVIIKVNNRKLLNGILEQAGIKEKSEALIAVDKLDKIGVTGVSAELIERGYSKEKVEKLFTYVKERVTLSTLKGLVYNEEGKQGLLELEELFSFAKAMGVDNLMFDISLTRGQAYYTGTVFEVYLQEGEVKSSLAGGGRYDDMIGKFMGGGRVIPAVGLSFGLAPIMDVLRLRGDVKGKSSAQVYVIPINTPVESLQVVQQLRSAGVKADFAQGKKGVSKNLEYASALGIPYVLIIGGDEIAQKKVLLRNMVDGTEQLLSVKDVIGKLRT